MAKIESEAAYKAAMQRIEKLLPLVNDNGGGIRGFTLPDRQTDIES